MDLSVKIEKLFQRYLLNKCNPDEKKLLSEFFDDTENEKTLKSLILAEISSSESVASHAESPKTKRKLKKILKKIIKDIRKTE